MGWLINNRFGLRDVGSVVLPRRSFEDHALAPPHWVPGTEVNRL
jgi:hypothetical protein